MKFNEDEKKYLEKIAVNSKISSDLLKDVIKGIFITASLNILEGKDIIHIPLIGEFTFKYEVKKDLVTFVEDVSLKIEDFKPTELFKKEVYCFKMILILLLLIILRMLSEKKMRIF